MLETWERSGTPVEMASCHWFFFFYPVHTLNPLSDSRMKKDKHSHALKKTHLRCTAEYAFLPDMIALEIKKYASSR